MLAPAALAAAASATAGTGAEVGLSSIAGPEGTGIEPAP